MRISKLNKPVVCITMGYPAGIGPEIISRALASPQMKGRANFLIVGDLSVFERALRLTGARLHYNVIRTASGTNFEKSGIAFLDLENVFRRKFHFGKVDAACGRASIEYIREAVGLIRAEEADLIVTAPIHKHAVSLSGFKYAGHTEYLAHLTNTRAFAMMLTGGPLRVVPATTHVPLKRVSQGLTRKRLIQLLSIMNASLKQYFGLPMPRIAVCGLNPHAGESGVLGDEDRTIIAPAINTARRHKIGASGPLAADAAFYNLYKGYYDAALCMYHDQGLIPLKMIARDEAVNITLGLPFIRTSPGHGTALDVAGKGIASAMSMKRAIRTALDMHSIKN